MNISEALRKIKKLKGELAIETKRMQETCSWLETKPEYDFLESEKKVVELKSKLVDLESKVALANATTKVKIGGADVSLAWVIRSLQEIKSSIALYEGLLIRNDKQVEKERVYDENYEKFSIEKIEKQWSSAVSVRQRDEHVASLKQKFEDFNAVLEKANHETIL